MSRTVISAVVAGVIVVLTAIAFFVTIPQKPIIVADIKMGKLNLIFKECDRRFRNLFI